MPPLRGVNGEIDIVHQGLGTHEECDSCRKLRSHGYIEPLLDIAELLTQLEDGLAVHHR